MGESPRRADPRGGRGGFWCCVAARKVDQSRASSSLGAQGVRPSVHLVTSTAASDDAWSRAAIEWGRFEWRSGARWSWEWGLVARAFCVACRTLRPVNRPRVPYARHSPCSVSSVPSHNFPVPCCSRDTLKRTLCSVATWRSSSHTRLNRVVSSLFVQIYRAVFSPRSHVLRYPSRARSFLTTARAASCLRPS